MLLPSTRRFPSTLVCAAAAALLLAGTPGTAKSGPDIDGAVDSLIAIPFDATGDLFGGAGLLISAVAGCTGDIVAVFDNNEYSHVLLRGLLSTPIRRLALGISQESTGVLEGFRNDDFQKFPESAGSYLNPDGVEGRFQTLGAGLGAAALSIVDTLGNTGQFLLRAVGAGSQADSIAQQQTDARTNWVGSATEGSSEIGMLKLGN